ncbi:MAG: hypothetical protein JSW46_18190 [Gemmatimonadota bacterium]|nr:MAG: hypothetical protein JSW46_18190 [Gemmatimonadota bacterium]
MICRSIILLLLVTAPTTAVAQDAHYWTYQYGTRANLLGGAVIGSVLDVSATFYNPGALSLIVDPDIIATSKVFELSSVKITPDVGAQVSLDNLRLDLAPGFVGGLLPFRFLGDHVLGYSLFTRYKFKSTLDAGGTGSLDELPQVGVPGDYLGLLVNEEDVSEFWVGITWSVPLGRRMGIGITQFGAYRSQKSKTRGLFEGFTDAAEGALSTREEGFSYWHFRFLWKAGLTLEWQGVSLGLTVTTPSVGVLSGGRALVNIAQFNVDIDGDGTPDPEFVASVQDGLSASYKSPWSVGLGATYSPRELTTLHVSAEYFGKVEESTVMELDPFEAQSIGDTVTEVLTQRLDDVLNFGVGLEHDFKPTLGGYAAFRTDFSAKPADAPLDVAFSSWDIFHLSGGTRFRIGTADLTLGLSYGWGSRRVEIGRPDEFSVVEPRALDVKYRTLRLILAFAL